MEHEIEHEVEHEVEHAVEYEFDGDDTLKIKMSPFENTEFKRK